MWNESMAQQRVEPPIAAVKAMPFMALLHVSILYPLVLWLFNIAM